MSAMRRPSMLLIQRVLPEWAAHIVATPELQTKILMVISYRYLDLT